ncbi:hypothetical protein [Xanthomonas tesorieronis]|uniref:hypothetical protein n=1 Tax=Xanthomonas tesorieronis TaxID=3160839 RepID=UPI0035156B61
MRRPRWPHLAYAVLLGAACSSVCLAQADAQTPTRRQRVALPQTIAPPCVSVAVEQATIVLSRTELERAAQARRTSANATHDDEAQRLAWIAGRRAQALLDVAGDGGDRFGCAPVAAKKAPSDSLYLVGQLLERGQAAVWARQRSGFAAAVEVAHFNPSCQHGPMGNVSYRVADGGPPLLMLIECVT